MSKLTEGQLKSIARARAAGIGLRAISKTMGMGYNTLCREMGVAIEAKDTVTEDPKKPIRPAAEYSNSGHINTSKKYA
jgi:hypothetical protein